MVTGKIYTLGTVGEKFSLKPDGRELEIAELLNLWSSVNILVTKLLI